MSWCSPSAGLMSDAGMGAASWTFGGCQLSSWAVFWLRGTCRALPALRGCRCLAPAPGSAGVCSTELVWGEVGDVKHMERGERE